MPQSVGPGPAESNTPIYDAVRYWGRKPHNLVAWYIEQNTEPGEVVLDPFCGSGVVAIEALRCGRRAVYNDISAYFRFLARTSAEPVDPAAVSAAAQQALNALRNAGCAVRRAGRVGAVSLDYLYATRCPQCGGAADLLGTRWTRVYRARPVARGPEVRGPGAKGVRIPQRLAGARGELAAVALRAYLILSQKGQMTHADLARAVKGELRSEDATRALTEHLAGLPGVTVAEVPTEVQYRCRATVCGGRGWTSTSPYDLRLVLAVRRMRPAVPYPQDPLQYPNGRQFVTYRPGCETLASLFTTRNLIVLASLRAAVLGLKCPAEVRDALLLALAATAEQASKMQRPNRKGWAVKNYIVHPEYLEDNVVEVFRRRVEAIVRAKGEAQSALRGNYIETTPRGVISGRGTVAFRAGDARSLPLPDEAVDYIFTDPEYGGTVQYYELSLLVARWAGLCPEWRKEIVENPAQGKDLSRYKGMLADAFREAARVLKPGKALTVTFHSREIKYWNALVSAIQGAGFAYRGAVYHVPQHEYTNWLYATNPGHMSGDVYITFERATRRRRRRLYTVEQLVTDVLAPEARRCVQEHGGVADFNQLSRAMTLRMLELGLLHSRQAADIDYKAVLDQVLEPAGSGKWRLPPDHRGSPLGFVPLERRIEWTIMSVFNAAGGQSLPIGQILSAIFTTLRNARTPENEEIMTVLRRLADPVAGLEPPAWALKAPTGVRLPFAAPAVPSAPGEELDHPRMIAVLAQLGNGMGFAVWISDREVSTHPDLEQWRTARSAAVRGMDAPTQRRLDLVDVVWFCPPGVPRAVLEVEHSTSPRDGLLRMANVFESLPHLSVDAFTILPDARAGQLPHILDEPSIQRLTASRPVYWAPYSEVTALADVAEYRPVIYQAFRDTCRTVGSSSAGPR